MLYLTLGEYRLDGQPAAKIKLLGVLSGIYFANVHNKLFADPSHIPSAHVEFLLTHARRLARAAPITQPAVSERWASGKMRHGSLNRCQHESPPVRESSRHHLR